MFHIEHPDVEGGAFVPERALAHYAENGWVLAGRTAATVPDGPPPAMPLPGRNASSAVWKTYAVVNGMDYDAAMAAHRDELADKYHPAEHTPAPTPKRAKRTQHQDHAVAPATEATPVVENLKES